MKTGAIVARFQVPELHAGHIHLIDTVKEKCDQVIILLGCTEKPDERNILSFEVREDMIYETYSDYYVDKIKDHREDNLWNEHLDAILDEWPNVTLYGSRDSFLKFYKGRYPTEYIEPFDMISGTEIRNSLPIIHNYSYRVGLIHGFNLHKNSCNDEK